jgi:cellobiose transport system substrate-binding protein
VSRTAERKPNGLAKVILVGTVGALVLSACSSSHKKVAAPASSAAATSAAATSAAPTAAATTSASAASTSAASGEKVTLKITDWGNFGLKGLIAQYQTMHPNITITEVTGDYNTTHENLQKFIVAGSGAPDISAIDEGFMVSFKNQADKFVDLNAAAGDRKANYIPWKWAASMSADGKQIGLGTDVGGLAMCYRTDLFAAAGLPTDRDAVSKLWPTWADFIATGKKYVAATHKKFLDDSVTIMNPVLGQQKVGYIDSTETLQMDGGPKAAWDIATQTITAGLSANLPQSDATAWAAGFKNNAFATVSCPAWMLGQIKTNSTGSNAKWDVADIPGGGGNWGGSWWTVPAQGKHTAEAVDLVKWLTEPAQQIAVFKDAGNLPSQPALWADPAIAGYTNAEFGNAPTGKIFTAAAAKLPDPPQYLGKKNGVVRVAVENALKAVEQGKFTPDSGWKQAVSDAKKAAEG